MNDRSTQNHDAIVCLSHTCEDEVLLPRVRGVNVTQRHISHASGDVQSSRTLQTTNAMSSKLGLRLQRALYLTAAGTATENIRRIASVAVGVPAGATSSMSLSLDIRVFMSGLPTHSVGSAETWLQMAEVSLGPSAPTSVALRTSQTTQVDMTTIVACSIDNA